MPDHNHQFPCGHSAELSSNRARDRWADADQCPRCWTAQPTLHLQITRLHRVTGQLPHATEESWYPGCRVEVAATSALGQDTPEETVDRVDDAAQQLLESLELRGEPETNPLEDPAWARRVMQAVTILKGMGHVRIGGHYAQRVADTLADAS